MLHLTGDILKDERIGFDALQSRCALQTAACYTMRLLCPWAVHVTRMEKTMTSARPYEHEFRPSRKVVHDLRNLFSLIAAATYLLGRNRGGTRQAELLKAINEAAAQGGKLTTELLVTTSPASQITTICVGETLHRLGPMMRAVTADAAMLTVDNAEQVWLRTTAADFEATVLEIVTNAANAHATTIKIRARRCGKRVWLLFGDNGCGMSASLLSRAQRGKERAGAHGTGLARVHRFADDSQGRVFIRSRPLIGTTIALALPCLPQVDENHVIEAQSTRPTLEGPRIRGFYRVSQPWEWVGYALGAIVALRLIWGVIGPREAQGPPGACRP
jgi:K+-sensing histidine kinase KdpD